MKDQLPTVSFYHTSELLQAVVAIWSRLISYLNPHHENAENHSVIVEPLRKHVPMRILRTFEQALSQSGGRKYRKQTFGVRRT